MIPSLFEAWQTSALRLPAKTALICGDRAVSHTALAAKVGALTSLLAQEGVCKGDRVVVMLDNSIEFVVSMLAVIQLQAVFVPVSPLVRSKKLIYVLSDTQASVLVTQQSLTHVWSDAIAAIELPHSVVKVLADTLLKDVETDEKQAMESLRLSATVHHNDKDLAAIIYTSGTSGRPKGVMLSHGNMSAARHSVQTYLKVREDDIIGLALPTAFSYGLYHVIIGLAVGSTVVLEGNAVFPSVILKNWEKNRVTIVPGVPTFFASLLSQDLTKFDLQSLRILTNAGAAIDKTLVDRLRSAFPNALLFCMYGLTECKRASYLPPDDLDKRANSVGRGIPEQRHWIVDESGREVAVGEIGQLVVAGPHVMQGYWNRPADTANALRPSPDGTPALYTGDLFHGDSDGYLYFYSRADDVFKSRGEKISPTEVEQVICELSGVREAVVSGMADELLGMAVCAHVRITGVVQLTARDIIGHCSTRLESYMVPKQVIIVDNLPLTESGKLLRASL